MAPILEAVLDGLTAMRDCQDLFLATLCLAVLGGLGRWKCLSLGILGNSAHPNGVFGWHAYLNIPERLRSTNHVASSERKSLGCQDNAKRRASFRGCPCRHKRHNMVARRRSPGIPSFLVSDLYLVRLKTISNPLTLPIINYLFLRLLERTAAISTSNHTLEGSAFVPRSNLLQQARDKARHPALLANNSCHALLILPWPTAQSSGITRRAGQGALTLHCLPRPSMFPISFFL